MLVEGCVGPPGEDGAATLPGLHLKMPKLPIACYSLAKHNAVQSSAKPSVLFHDMQPAHLRLQVATGLPCSLLPLHFTAAASALAAKPVNVYQ